MTGLAESATAVGVRVPDFGDQEALDRALAPLVNGLPPSGILKIVAEIRGLMEAGRSVINLSIGDFDPKYFPIPERLVRGIQGALERGVTNYPAPPGVLALRQAISRSVERACGVRYPVESVLVASGGRPILYGAYHSVVAPGDTVVYAVPSWQNEAYTWLTGAKTVIVEAKSAQGFQPTLDLFAPYVRTARLICLCSPGNPTGTAMEPEVLREILEAVVEENRRRERVGGERPLFVLHDQIYGSLWVRGDKHRYAAAIVPESAPYVMAMDGASKAFAGTGIRVAWLLAAPAIARRMGELLGHVGAWAPHAEQVGVAELLDDVDAVQAYRREMDGKIRERLEAMYAGFAAMRDEGLPVECIDPDGAMYVSLQFRLREKRFRGEVLQDNEAIRSLLLKEAGIALVPFQAFGLMRETGWFRGAVGTVSMEEIAELFPRIRGVLREVE